MKVSVDEMVHLMVQMIHQIAMAILELTYIGLVYQLIGERKDRQVSKDLNLYPAAQGAIMYAGWHNIYTGVAGIIQTRKSPPAYLLTSVLPPPNHEKHKPGPSTIKRQECLQRTTLKPWEYEYKRNRESRQSFKKTICACITMLSQT
jgi:hypothetical protein